MSASDTRDEPPAPTDTPTRPLRIFSAAKAKARLSEIINSLDQEGPVIITNHGHPVALLIGLKGVALGDLVNRTSILKAIETSVRAVLDKIRDGAPPEGGESP